MDSAEILLFWQGNQIIRNMKNGFFGHPSGLSTLFFTEMWERFSYYGMRALLVLYLSAQLIDGGMGLSIAEASAIYGLYTAFVYLMALPGGWIADNILGQRKTVFYGGIVIAAGHFTMAIPNNTAFFIGLILVILGTGLLKPNISTMVGDLYPEGGARRDAGFSVFYMGINLGAFLGPLLCGYFAEKVDWHMGFGLAGVGMVLGLIQYQLTGKNLGEIGLVPKAKEEQLSTSDASEPIAQNKLFGWIIAGALILAIIVFQLVGFIDLTTFQGFAEATGFIIISIVIAYFSYLFLAGGLTIPEKKKVAVILILFFAAALFWSGFEQAGSSLNLFAKYFTDLNFGGWSMPASWFQSVNSFFIITLAPLFGLLWIRLSQRNLEPSSPMKFAFGLILLGLGFLAMVGASNIVVNGLSNGVKAGSFWLILTYFLHTTGELALSPVGLSTTTKLAPKRYVGQMMGIWFVGTAFGNLIAGLAAGRFDFSLFDKTDKALGALEGAEKVDDVLLEKIDASVLEKIDPQLVERGDLEGMRQSVESLLASVSTESLPELPNLFMSIFLIAAGGGLVLFVFSPLVKRWMGDVH